MPLRMSDNDGVLFVPMDRLEIMCHVAPSDVSRDWMRKMSPLPPRDPTIDCYTRMMSELCGDHTPTFEQAIAPSSKASEYRSQVERQYAQKSMVFPNVNPALVKSIIAYTGSLYTELNGRSREGKLKGYMLLHANIDSGLNSLPPMPIGTQVVRWTRLPADVLRRYQKGQIIIDLALMSTSKKVGGVQFGSGDGQKVKFTVRGKETFSGRDVSKISLFPSEEEVLFPQRTRFEVASREEEGDYVHITLDELFRGTGAKVLLWVDDRPSNNADLVQSARMSGVEVIPVETAEAAIAFLCSNAFLMQRDLGEFRIITDMAHAEDQSAGHRLQSLIRNAFCYPEPMMAYTGQHSMKRLRDGVLKKEPKMLYTDGAKLLRHGEPETSANCCVRQFVCFEFSEHFPKPDYESMAHKLLKMSELVVAVIGGSDVRLVSASGNLINAVWAMEHVSENTVRFRWERPEGKDYLQASENTNQVTIGAKTPRAVWRLCMVNGDTKIMNTDTGRFLAVEPIGPTGGPLALTHGEAPHSVWTLAPPWE